MLGVVWASLVALERGNLAPCAKRHAVGGNLCGAETLINAGYFEWKSVGNDTFLRIGGI